MKVSPQSVTLIDYMGTDLSVVNAARVSFDKESKWEVEDPFGANETTLSDKDAKLIGYLAKHNHFTPFTHASTTFRIKCPIFVARQLHKHQVGFTVNEVSRRYVDSEPECYLPTSWRSRPDSSMKQGSGDKEITHLSHTDQNTGESWTVEVNNSFFLKMEADLTMYNDMLKAGISPEQARMVLPLNTMTEFYMTGSLYGWSRMCKLRLDPHAQREIQDVAKLVSTEMQKLYPVSWEALLA